MAVEIHNESEKSLMKHVRNPVFYFIPCLLILFSLTSCSFFDRIPDMVFGPDEVSPESLEARMTISYLKDQNNAVETFKGIGRIKAWEKNKSRIARVAWLGSGARKLRIEVLDLISRPMASIVCDGEQFCFLSHADQKFYKRNTTNPNLKDILFISVNAYEVIALLAGRIPIREHRSATLTKEPSGYLLILKSGWGNTLERIYLDETKTSVHKIEMFDTFGSLSYQAEFGKIKEIGGHRIPFHLALSNDEDAGFQLRIDRYWVNVPVSFSKFKLNP